MLQRYSRKGYPSEFPLRSKCIALFQKIHGVDTLLFALYVYEYGDECPTPNRRSVYISYLDSVRYFEPKCYRTTAYHSIMVEYLRCVKKRGFHSAYIWSCPPVGGDDYVFYCHPKHQLVPREDMLRSWYHKMLDQAKAQGIVIRTSTLYDDFFTNDIGDPDNVQIREPTCLPYFEGDYIPGEIEIIIQQLDDAGETAVANSPQDSVMVRLGHNLSKMKDNFIVVQLRSRRFIDAVQSGQDVSNWKEDSDDEVIRSKRAKISSKSSPESYSQKIELSAVVAAPTMLEKTDSSTGQLASVRSVVEMERDSSGEPRGMGIEIQMGDVVVGSNSLPGLGADEVAPEASNGLDAVHESVQNRVVNSSEPASDVLPEDLKGDPPHTGAHANSVTESETRPEGQSEGTVSKVECNVDDDSRPVDLGDNALFDENCPSDPSSQVVDEAAVVKDLPDIGYQESDGALTVSVVNEEVISPSGEHLSNFLPEKSSNKRILDEIKPAIEIHVSGRNGVAMADTTDEDPHMDNELFESRQQFLNYCQATHCQFDELRRAKHSTVMVLFQLHNPSAPKSLQQCGACYRDITHGIRYHCNECSNFDLCDDCYEPVVTGLWAKRDPRFAHDKKHSFSPIDMESTEETQKSIADRLKSLKAHVELLEHAGICEGPPKCSLHNCDRLKKLFVHVPSCDVKPKRDCKICTRLLVLCTMHARMCNARGSCPIPFCDRMRERNKRLRRQQQLMDDRRRQAQNELYHAGGEV